MKRISTHILDLVLGKPAINVPVRLEKEETAGWRVLESQRTDSDGRCSQLLPDGEDLSAGEYRITFDIKSYYAAQKADAFYPLVEVRFHVREGETQFHLPLLLSPNGYTTYRGS